MQTRCYVNINKLPGFEISDLKTGEILHRVEVQGFQMGALKRHGYPSQAGSLSALMAARSIPPPVR